MRLEPVIRRARTAWRREDGQVTTAVACIAMVAIVFVAFYGVTGLAKGSGEKSKAQSAADAAALAGAKEIRTRYLEIPLLVGDLSRESALGNLFDIFSCGMGRSEAAGFALRNDAQLSSYCYSATGDRVRVEVQMGAPVSSKTGPARAESQASVGFRPITCEWDYDAAPAPAPSPSPSPSPSTDPEPIVWPDTFVTLDCGYFTAKFKIDLDDCITDPTDIPDLKTCARDLVGSVDVDEDAFSVRLEN